MALVLAVQKWRHYLLGRTFVIRTDHASLKFLWDQQIHTTAQQKWLVKLLGYDFVIEYKPGKENKVADALSRQHEGASQETAASTTREEGTLSCTAISIVVPQWLEEIKQTYNSNEQLGKLRQQCVDNQLSSNWTMKDDILFYKNRIYLTTGMEVIPTILKEFHDGTHEGVQKTLKRLRAVFYWSRMYQDVLAHLRGCEVCQQFKSSSLAPAGLLQPLPIPQQIWTSISMDFITGLPRSTAKDGIFVVVDRLTKYSHFIPLAHPFTASKIAQLFFEGVFKLHGMPTSIICDRDPTFTSAFWNELFRLQGVAFNYSSAYHPQTDGQTEVINRVLEQYLRCFSADRPHTWTKWLPWSEYCYNTSFQTAIRMSPFEALYNCPPPTLLTYIPGSAKSGEVDELLQHRDQLLRELKDNLTAAQTRMKHYHDLRRRDVEFQVGQQVYLKLQPYRQHSMRSKHSNKLAARFYGPFPIIQRIGQVAYKLELPANSQIHNVFHISQLKAFVAADVQIHSSLPTAAAIEFQ